MRMPTWACGRSCGCCWRRVGGSEGYSRCTFDLGLEVTDCTVGWRWQRWLTNSDSHSSKSVMPITCLAHLGWSCNCDSYRQLAAFRFGVVVWFSVVSSVVLCGSVTDHDTNRSQEVQQ